MPRPTDLDLLNWHPKIPEKLALRIAEQTPHDPMDCNGEDCQICRQFWKDDMADRTERNE
jgi:hypothetical protein